MNSSMRISMAENDMGRVSEIDLVHVAIGENVETNQSLLLYALQKLQAKRICIIYVHKQPKLIFGSKLKAKKLAEQNEEYEQKVINHYSELCRNSGASVDSKCTASKVVEKGIVELIATHQIRFLVMGAGAEEKHKGGLKQLASSKAKYVNLHASHFCEVVFVFKGEAISLKNRGAGGHIEYEPSPSHHVNITELPIVPVDVIDDYPPSPPFDFPTWDCVNEIKQKLSEEVSLRAAAQSEAREAERKAKEWENLYREELKKREELEQDLRKEREKVIEIRNEKIRFASKTQKLSAETELSLQRLAEADAKTKLLEKNFLSSMELLIEYRSELRAVCEKTMPVTGVACEFMEWEIKEATNNYDASLKIGRGGYGTTYSCFLRQTHVAIKVRDPNVRGVSEFHQEVAILGRVRHPNVVILMGMCRSTESLVYEYLPHGSLEDRLNCMNKTPPLTWPTRLRIAADLCSVLVFLHSSVDHCVVHGDLKPSNVLLGANFVPKLSDFGVPRLMKLRRMSETKKMPWERDLYPHVDPEFGYSGALTPRSDLYSFGVLLLRLLTNKPARGLPAAVMNARKANNLMAMLDSAGGEWPFVVADQVAELAVRCCAAKQADRWELETEVWRVLRGMRALCVDAENGEADHAAAPPYFVCPIFQEVMGDPHVAADGFTYEAEAVKGWFDCGHDTSPMTNLKLPNCNLVPNRALRSAIQEWQQHR